jgi:hypothetical protein
MTESSRTDEGLPHVDRAGTYEAGQGLLSKRFSVAKNSADGGLGGCAREFAIRINRSNSARSVAA